MDDQYLDLKKLSDYGSVAVPTLREYIKGCGLPAFKLKGKILVRKSEYDHWMEQHRIDKSQDLGHIVDEVMESITGASNT